MYKYETHCHTNLISKCSNFEPQQIVDLFIKNGFTGVFITDHFLNGNCVDKVKNAKSYKDKITEFCKGYKEVKSLAKDKLQVFFGFEYSYLGTDFLVYGWDEEKLKNIPEIMDMSAREFILYANANGAFTVQAHPFREAGYIDHIRIFPEVQGIETLNTSRDDRTNRLANNFANEYKKYKFAGSDIHGTTNYILGGMAFSEKLKDEKDFIEKVKKNEYKIFKVKNKW